MFKIFLICLAFIVVYSTTSLCQWDSDQAYKIQTDTSQFDNNLASTETNVQAALDVLDNLTVSGGGVNTTILKDNATVGTQPNVNFNNTATVQWTISNVTADGQIKVTAASTASAAPAGVNQSVQYNDSGSTGGEAAFTYNKDLDMLTVRNWTVADTFSSSAKVDHNTTANYSATFHFLKTEVDHNATENYTAARHLLTSEIDHNTTANYSATYHFTMASVDHNATTNYDANRHKLESETTHNNTLGYEAQYHFKTTEVPHNTTTGFETNRHLLGTEVVHNTTSGYEAQYHFTAASVDHNATTNFVANRHLLGTEVVHNTTSGYEAAFHLAVGDIAHNSTSGYEAGFHLGIADIAHNSTSGYEAQYHFKQADITTVGTIGTGTWQATDVGVAYGGTGQSNLDNLIALTANTTGNYVQNVSTVSPLSGGAAGSEGAQLSISLDAHAISLKNQTKGVAVYNITTAYDFHLWQTPKAITITEIVGHAVGGTSVNITLEEWSANAGTLIGVIDVVDIASGTEKTESTITGATIPAGNWTYCNTTAVSGAVTFVTLTVKYDED